MDEKSQNLVSELSRLYSDEDTTNFDVSDFIFAFGSPLEALAYAKLFWPDFVQVDEMLLRSDVIEDESDAERVRQALRQWNGDSEKTQRSFNRLEIPAGIFGKRAGESSDASDEQLAQILVEMWDARLSRRYPDRKFSVTLERESDGDVSVTFCQTR
jgi:hypothetical protein